MNRYMAFVLLAFVCCTRDAWPAAAIFSGSDIKILKQNLDLNGQAKILTGTANPTSSAQNAPQGSVYLRTGASGGQAYTKQDSGSTTNWLLVNAGTVSVVSSDKALQARLTLESGVPVSTTDQTAKTTIYLTPYKGDQIALYDGVSAWALFTLTEISLAVPATTNTMYDVFVYNNSGLTLEAVAWTNDTTRATALVLQNGVYVKSGSTTKRYVGSFRTTGSSGQTEDSLTKRYVYNYFNRISRSMWRKETTDSWTYSTASWRQANGSTANQLDFVIGISEDKVEASTFAWVVTSTSGYIAARSGIGLDSTTVDSANLSGYLYMNGPTTYTNSVGARAFYTGYPGVGRHYLAWLEQGGGSATQTWYGDSINASGDGWSGIIGEIFN